MTEGLIRDAQRNKKGLEELDRDFQDYRDEIERPTWKHQSTTGGGAIQSATFTQIGDLVSFEAPKGCEIVVTAKLTLKIANVTGAAAVDRYFEFKLVRSTDTATILDYDRRSCIRATAGAQYDSVSFTATDRPPAGPVSYEVMVKQDAATDATVTVQEQYWEIVTRRSRVGKNRTL